MLLTDEEIIKKLRIKPSERVLDIGGSMRQHEVIKIDTLVDIMRPEDAPYGPTKLLAKNYVKVDITRDRLPFKDNQFDIVLCTHTLEDLPTPFNVMEEMQRVARRGLIVTPNMGRDMVFTDIDFTDWLSGARRVPGEAHHKWFFVNKGSELKVIPKNYAILYTSQFQIVKWMGESEMVYVWKNKINFTEVKGLNIHNLIDEYKRFLIANKKKIKFGHPVVFFDNPFKVLKAYAKLFLKRGKGYSFRKYL